MNNYKIARISLLMKQLREALAEGREVDLTASSLGRSIERQRRRLRVAIMVAEKQK